MSGLREVTQPFYSSRAWKDCREAYIKSVGGLCERCKQAGRIAAGEEVHHKIRLDAATVKNPRVALDWANLELLCEACHKAEHRKTKERRWRCGPDGRVVPPLVSDT